ncbi:hypothetical protein [Cetobacterium sp. 2G large]|uniref:hypothetical protein n=1 Tax=Cetobacterium sp. 2G large TaxID=2759680 RepID=UPI00163B66C4|nr:hypothetical protein [Cetobacterium sp. 2G large]MBC2854716.1 hypothetical protein [Cetobacterium sp. 2G large]
MEKKAYLEVVNKRYTYLELIDLLQKKEIVSLKNIKQKISNEKLEDSIIENEIEIKVFKSYYSDKYILLTGGKYLVGIYRQLIENKDYNYILEELEDKYKILNKIKLKNDSIFQKSVRLNILYSNEEKENRRAVYKRIKNIYGISLTKFLKNEEGKNNGIDS